MKDLVNWITAMEKMAHSLYVSASSYFKDDKPFSDFLDHMAQDEDQHVQLMKRASHILATSPDIKPLITPDNETKGLIELPLQRSRAMLSNGTLTRESLIDFMVATEFSEWNDIFLYVVNTLKEIDGGFASAVPAVQHHIRHLEKFLESTQYGRNSLAALRSLPAVWEEQILVVEDNRIMAEFLEALLEREGGVTVAHNGEDGLRRLKKNYYRVIVSDVDMPLMNGIQFFEQAVGIYPAIRSRFIFITGDLSPERQEFFAKNQVRHLCKPATVSEIRSVVREVMEIGAVQ